MTDIIVRRSIRTSSIYNKYKKRGEKSVSFDRTDSEAPSSSFINTSPGNPLNIYMLTFDASGGGGRYIMRESPAGSSITL